jgi:hypothetical protein
MTGGCAQLHLGGELQLRCRIRWRRLERQHRRKSACRRGNHTFLNAACSSRNRGQQPDQPDNPAPSVASSLLRKPACNSSRSGCQTTCAMPAPVLGCQHPNSFDSPRESFGLQNHSLEVFEGEGPAKPLRGRRIRFHRISPRADFPRPAAGVRAAAVHRFRRDWQRGPPAQRRVRDAPRSGRGRRRRGSAASDKPSRGGAARR